MKQKQTGFAIIELLLILLLLAIVGGTGYYVWHSKQQTDKTLSSAADTNVSVHSVKKTSSKSTTNDNNTQNTLAAEQFTSQDGLLVLKEWSVTFKPSSDTPTGVFYRLQTLTDSNGATDEFGSQYQEADFYSTQAAALGEACTQPGSETMHIYQTAQPVNAAPTLAIAFKTSINGKYYTIVGDKSGGSCVDGVKEGDSVSNNPKMAKEAEIDQGLFTLAQTIQSK